MAKTANSIIIGCWLVFLAYWFITALRVKATAERKSFGSSLVYRIPFILGAFLLWDPRSYPRWNFQLIPRTAFTEAFGALVCVTGLGVTLWARWTLAGNWSSEVTFKRDHELITAGPYRFVRHPIYSGLLLMLLATPLEVGWLRCWLGLVAMFVGLWIKLKQEEALLLQHFPDDYPAYQKRVKALVPFVM